MMKGRNKHVMQNLIIALTDVTESNLEVKRDQIKVEIQELEEGNFAVGGTIAEERK